MCLYQSVNRAIWRIKVQKRVIQSRCVTLRSQTRSKIGVHTTSYLFFSMFSPFSMPIYVTGRLISCNRLVHSCDLKLTSLKDQGGVGSNNFNLRTSCEEYLFINININDLRGSICNTENYIISGGKHMDRNMVLIIRNLHNSHLICNIITITYNV